LSSSESEQEKTQQDRSEAFQWDVSSLEMLSPEESQRIREAAARRSRAMDELLLFSQLQGHNETLADPDATLEDKEAARYWLGQIEIELKRLEDERGNAQEED
jgi:hypothetical protein